MRLRYTREGLSAPRDAEVEGGKKQVESVGVSVEDAEVRVSRRHINPEKYNVVWQP